MEKWYLYVLKSLKDGNFYIGISRNPKQRLLLHNRGKTKSTKRRRPFVLVYVEEHQSLREAREIEKYYKRGVGREKIRSLIKSSPVAQ